MFCKVSNLKSGVPCKVVSWANTEKKDSDLFTSISQKTFITDLMPPEAKVKLFGHQPPFTNTEINAVVKKWIAQAAIKERIYFFGSTAELGTIAAKKCLKQAKGNIEDIDAIIGGTNTGPGYPSLADHIKLNLGGQSNAMCYDTTEACTVGASAIFQGWSLIRSGACKKVLVVCAEKANTLTTADNYFGANLFGDAAFAVLLSAADKDDFLFFDFQSLPYDGNIEAIIKAATGFQQVGEKVHKFVGREVVNALVAALEKAGIDPMFIKHLISHQPSGKTLKLLMDKLLKQWENVKFLEAFSNFSFSKIKQLITERKNKDQDDKYIILFHRNVDVIGNASGASTGSLISRGLANGTIKKGDIVLVVTFGAGLSIGIYAFVVGDSALAA